MCIKKKYFKYFEDLKNTNHSYGENMNSWHLEDNCWTHTLMVEEKAREFYPDDEILRIAAVLHDIGKPYVKTVENSKTKFYNHESFGVFKAVELLNTLDISRDDKIRVLELIQRHSDSYKYSKKSIELLYNQEAYNDVLKIRKCDMLGRNSMYEEDEKKAYELESKIIVTDKKIEKDPNKPTVTFLIGPPASGKTVYTKKYPGRVFSRDDIIMELGESDKYIDNYESVDQEEVNRIFNSRLKKLVKSKEDFILDMTLITAKVRRRFMQLIHGYNYKAVVFINSYDELLRRNNSRTQEGKKLQEDVIKSFCKRFQMIYPGEKFYDVKYVFEDDEINDLKDTINEVFKIRDEIFKLNQENFCVKQKKFYTKQYKETNKLLKKLIKEVKKIKKEKE